MRALSSKPLRIIALILAILLAADFSYRVREFLAVLLIFTVIFVAVALVLFILSALNEALYHGVFYFCQHIFHARRKSFTSVARQSRPHRTGSSSFRISYESIISTEVKRPRKLSSLDARGETSKIESTQALE